jgi:excisionase family DNA binding protein
MPRKAIMREAEMPTKVLTVKEAADYLRIHTSTIYRLLKRKELPAFRVGSDWRFNVEDIDRWRLGDSNPSLLDTQIVRKKPAQEM